MFENARKYYSHALVLIDNTKEERVNNNVARALWGLIKTCKNIQKQSPDNQKNLQILAIAQKRVGEIYQRHTDVKVEKL